MMGEHKAKELDDHERHRAFTRALLDDVRALERMIDGGRVESGVRRIGAEQEFFLVDPGGAPAPVSMEVLEKLDDEAFTTELARFNLEVNLQPSLFEGDCLRRMERELVAFIDKARAASRECGADVLLTGILPTLQLSDLGLENMTPVARYAALNDALVRHRGGEFQVRIKGIDELFAVHDNVMLESCNTSFQIHFQVWPEEFARLYNLAQAITAPVLAAAANSPILLERRLWHETRVALFQHSVDDRSPTHLARGQRSRVHFGDKWVDDSVLEIYQEDIARFRVVLATEIEENSLEMLARGEVPRLRALAMHNGTVYRWNRPCFGVRDGKLHLRIENRVLPAGPTIVDEVANAAFYYGLMAALADEYGDITKVMSFDDAKASFIAAARHGLRAQITWTHGRTSSATDLILEHLLPLAREGLFSHDVDTEDIERYLGVIEQRVRSGMTGAQWALNSLSGMSGRGSMHDRCRALTVGTLVRQKSNEPVHDWSLARLDESDDWRHSYKTVGQFMTKDLFTVRPDDLVDLAANLMDWKHIRHVPVEDEEGHLVGLVSHRGLVRLLAGGPPAQGAAVAVRSIMRAAPVTVTPETKTLDAIQVMREHRVGCLPVVSRGKLVGILTERDLIDVAANLLESQLREFPRR